MALVNKTFSDIITFTRASTATYFDSTGTLQSAATNAPRFDYNPATLAAQGLLIEESRTNSIRNNTMVGAVAGTPGTLPTNWFTQVNTTTGLTSSVVGTGTENGVTYIDLKYSGTASGAGSIDIFFDNAATIAASTGQVWAPSIYLKLAAGSLTGLSAWRFYLYEYTSAPVFITAQTLSLSAPTAAGLSTQRQSGPLTLSGGAGTASIRPLINVSVASGAAIDITLRIGLPQLELGAFATSVIPTTTTAVTRAADVASVNTLSPWFNSVEGTLYSETQQAQDRTAGFPVVAGISDSGSGVNTIEQYWTNSASSLGLIVYASSSIQANLQNSGLTRTNVQKVASAYKVNDFASTVGGGTVQTDTSGTIPVVDRLTIGARPGGGSNINGWVRRFVYYPRRLSNAELQSITS